VAISPAIATMKLYELRLRVGIELFIWFLSTRLLNWFLLTWILTLFANEHFSQSSHELDGFLEIIGLWGKHRWSWGCV
jgi:hypothetical protein